MQFKHPEILYFLGLLIIPVLVHLFQLQRFKKVAFTNVAFLQKLVRENRKSSQLKKWLILSTRLLLFTSVIIAFSQPYLSKKNEAKKEVVFIYLDNSLSTTAKGEKGPLLQTSIQEIIENSNHKLSYSLLTNTSFDDKINALELKKKLLKVKKEASSKNLKQVFLKINSLNIDETKRLDKIILISDFQKTNTKNNSDFTNVTLPISYVQVLANQKNNLSIDSVFVKQENSHNFTINVVVKNQGTSKKNIPIAVFNNNRLIAKQTFFIEKNKHKTILFPIQNQEKFNGKIVLNFEDLFAFDNTYYFSVNSTTKINVLSIGNSAEFLSKIYSKNEFNFKSTSLKNVDYNSLQKQDLVILNELKTISTTLAKYLKIHLQSGGSISIIPNNEIQIDSYNSFFKQLAIGKITKKYSDSLKITNIHYKNLFFKNVFTKSIQNFQYPFVKNSYLSNFRSANSIISFENKKTFISELNISKGTLYWVSAPINTINSNFINSPLVVPIFYNFGKLSLKNPKTYYTINKENTLDISTTIKKNEVLSINNNTISFIPQQQIHQHKVRIKTYKQPNIAGLYTIKNKENTIETIAFNYDFKESLVQFLEIKKLIKEQKNAHFSTSIKNVLGNINKKNEVTWLWKWFLTLAIVSLCFEILILKFFKP